MFFVLFFYLSSGFPQTCSLMAVGGQHTAQTHTTRPTRVRGALSSLMEACTEVVNVWNVTEGEVDSPKAMKVEAPQHRLQFFTPGEPTRVLSSRSWLVFERNQPSGL